MDRWYPADIEATSIDDYLSEMDRPDFTTPRIDLMRALFPDVARRALRLAEFGVWQGAATGQFARFLDHQGELHIFDYEDTVRGVIDKLGRAGWRNIVGWGNSYRYLDSYNWSLKTILEHRADVRFDYVYLDGAHTWAVDALTFFLCDMLIKPGGFIEFDDHAWTLRGSSLDPALLPATAALYTDEQIDCFQVRAILDLVVRRRGTYREVFPNRLFQKIA